ncbi:MAG: GGDEF domain-containing protein [Rubrivivax sp.]
MHLDLTTLLWVMPFVTSVMGVSVLLAHPRVGGAEGLGTWGLGLLVNAASYPAFAWRFTGELGYSIVATNVLAAASVALHALAVAQFRAGGESAPRAWPAFVPVVLTGLIALGTLDEHRARNALVAVVLLAQAAWLLRLAVPPPRALLQERGRLLLVLGSGLLVALLPVRTLRVAFGDEWPETQAIAPDIQAQTYLAMLAVLLLNTTGYLLMHMGRAVEQQRAAATRDALTGALTRRPLMEAFEQGLSLAVREGQPYAVLMLDLDHFKRVNDAHGHPAGDAVLRQFTQRIAQRLRRSDLLGRYGGEEFIVLLPGTDLAGARTVAEGMRRATEQEPFTFGALRIPVTVSIGLSLQPAGGASSPGGGVERGERVLSAASEPEMVEPLIARADRALYAAKRNGRNRVEVAD